jgi:hypothetical protein
MKNAKVLGGELEVTRARVRASVGKIPPPDSILADLHGIFFAVGERVIDTVTGEEVEVLGAGVQNVEAGE